MRRRVAPQRTKSNPQDDSKEKVYMGKVYVLDHKHSERNEYNKRSNRKSLWAAQYDIRLCVSNSTSITCAEIIAEIDPDRWVVSKLTMHAYLFCQYLRNFHRFPQISEDVNEF